MSGGPTAADAEVARDLNARLQANLRGYLDAYRVSCARAVVEAVRARGLDERAAVIAVTTTIVETGIRNISEEVDHDSLGLFQQRASWGSRANRLDPKWSTNAFLNKMLSTYPNNSWRTAPIGQVCQAVQVSAFPDRYQVEAGDAQRIVEALKLPRVVSVYGVLPDGRLTYTEIEAATGNRIRTVVSGAELGFTPKALATLDYNTLLITSTAGKLYRVDIITNANSLAFSSPIVIGDRGWTHDLLSYDGRGSLYGIAGAHLLRYQVNSAKPTASHITGRTDIGRGFTLKTLTTTGQDTILGTTTEGTLRSYRIHADGTWDPATLREQWGSLTHLLSPGHGLYYGRKSDGSMYHYRDADPYDGNGDDIQSHSDDPVDRRGWTQTLLSARPVG